MSRDAQTAGRSAPNGRIALVTGGTRGIGLGVAHALAPRRLDARARGDDVTPSAVAEALASVRALGADVDYIAADVARSGGSRHGSSRPCSGASAPSNALVNNAGRAPRVRADLLEATEASFEEMLRTNLQGPYFLTQRAAPYARRAQARTARTRPRRSCS